jgi:hypothetical protein
VRDGSVTPAAERRRSVVPGGAPDNAGPNSTRADQDSLAVPDAPEIAEGGGADGTAAAPSNSEAARRRGDQGGAHATAAASGDAPGAAATEASAGASGDAADAGAQGGDPADLATADPVVTGAQASDDSTGALPFTGSDVPLLAGLGLLALAVGVALRRTAPARRVSRGGA